MPTNLMRWDPFRDVAAFRTDLERLLARAPDAPRSSLPRRWSPASDVVETDDAIVITAELPGVKDEDIDITVHDRTLRIAGERTLEEEVREDRFYRLERSYGGFEREYPLPPGVREEDISAGVAYGVLKITIPKPAQSQPKKIEVKEESNQKAKQAA